MRVYLVIMDETDEAGVALRFAAHRAARTGGAVHLLALVPRQPFVAFGGIQATIEEEARVRAEALVTSAAGAVMTASGARRASGTNVNAGLETDSASRSSRTSALITCMPDDAVNVAARLLDHAGHGDLIARHMRRVFRVLRAATSTGAAQFTAYVEGPTSYRCRVG